jgi:hypothetical protein
LYGNFAARSIRPGPTIFINGESPGSLLAIDDTEADLNSASSAGAFGPTTASADTLPDPAGTARSASLGAASGTATLPDTLAAAASSTSPPDTLPRIIPSDFDALVADTLSSGTTAASDAGNAAPDAPDDPSGPPAAASAASTGGGTDADAPVADVASSTTGLDPRICPLGSVTSSAEVSITLNPPLSPLSTSTAARAISLILNNFYVI